MARGVPPGPWPTRSGWFHGTARPTTAVGFAHAGTFPARLPGPRPQSEEQLYFVDGKWGLRPKAEVQDASGAVLAEVRGTATGIKKELTITDAAGAELASLKGKFFSPVKNSMTITLPSGETWLLEGSIMERTYTVASEGRPVLDITQKWVTVRDTFTLDIADGVDPVLALAVLWGVDRFAEQR